MTLVVLVVLSGRPSITIRIGAKNSTAGRKIPSERPLEFLFTTKVKQAVIF